MSQTGSDRGWDTARDDWTNGDNHGPQYHNVPWHDVVRESDEMLDDPHAPNAVPTLNVRPRDKYNRHEAGDIRGLFLELGKAGNRDASGIRPIDERRIMAPVYIDTAIDHDLGMVRVLYWFFYELNYFHVGITHEGDWEHVSLVFTEDAFRAGRPPGWVYLAQHNVSELLAFDCLERGADTHIVIYVDRQGHPCCAAVPDRLPYQLTWRTWECPLDPVMGAPWHRFAGAWGEIGNIAETTGPLGPYYKRYRDEVKLVRRNGELCLKEKRKTVCQR